MTDLSNSYGAFSINIFSYYRELLCIWYYHVYVFGMNIIMSNLNIMYTIVHWIVHENLFSM